MSNKLSAILALALVFSSCSPKAEPEIPIIIPDIPVEVPVTEVDRSDYPKAAWALAFINVNNLNTREKVESELSKAVKYGLNEIWLDVKPSTGKALYDSDLLPRFESWGEQSVPEGYDYLGTVLEVAEQKGIKVVAAINTLGFGDTQTRTGLLYESSRWEGHTQCKLEGGEVKDIVDLQMLSED